MTTPSDVSETKRSLRREIRERLRTLSPEQRSLASKQAVSRMLDQSLWKRASSVLLFAPLADELDLWPLAAAAALAGKTVALPRFDPEHQVYRVCVVKDLEREVVCGAFGIREPAASLVAAGLNQLDLAVVPGVAFDRNGRRLGRGRGYYDRLLTVFMGIKCGAGFDEQVVGKVPSEPHDVVLDCILTPSRWIVV